ncbi:MAG: bifunctional diaminohydroxyphosphoribosylaminopyrimidine deaminase/5-amino-6-(5-phosphoribosylamino)uracil reductase RibD [Deltaproteobacteria bacterium]|nr:bifunctional diaminohydroxyphosphoribosylaminopyrimidine deaminase/5-amino-6-(5-phosphoribosylamino)uracil reductase RibD [Deltaproteobacteria bacterium]MBN2671319.1 bifunctional diaminohydroxyphosphoribosylaminopyrimidine deaminase/5-amino-6-(5-phosphoribosylamino)uracil reductase RibD [Deltaproteobacteria bacterium]
MAQAKDDAYYMSLALQLARRCKPSPNPQVGAVIVKDNCIIGQGYHHAPGMPHAEIEALHDAKQAGNSVTGATMYVTLEPCCHHGRTGPCCEAIHHANIARVVVGMKDPDKLVSGKGISFLEKHEHEVTVGIEESACRLMLDTYTQHRLLKRPLIHLKAAVSMDGFLATTTGDSKWITGPATRAKGHELRSKHDAIIVGIGTVLADNPMLTVRDAEGTNPTRVVLDTHLRIPLSAAMLQSSQEADVILLHSENASPDRIAELKKIPNVHLQPCNTVNGKLDIKQIISQLNDFGFLSALVEGGSSVHGAFLKSGLADRFSLFVAPKILGSGVSWSGGVPGVKKVTDSIQADKSSIRISLIEGDTLIEGTFPRSNLITR